MQKARYEYQHYAGYGRDDHMADEIIARAARHLGFDGAGEYVLAARGFVSHAVPMGSPVVSLPCCPGVRRRMLSALRKAMREVLSNDCAISVVCRRERLVRSGAEWSRDTIVTEERRGARWIIVDIRDA